MGANYRAGGMMFIASGAVDHASMVKLVEEKFASLQPGDAPALACAASMAAAICA